MDSEIPSCRDLMESRNSRISRRTLSFSLHTHAIGKNPWAAAYSVERVSFTYTRGRINRTLPFCDCDTGGSEAMRPLKRTFLNSDSAQSSAVWPRARTPHPSSEAILYRLDRRW